MTELVTGMPECPICFEVFNTKDIIPRILPQCGHCLCEACVQRLIAAGMRQQACPHCRRDVVPKHVKKDSHVNIDLFPKNWTLMDTIEVVQRAEEREKISVFDPSSVGLEALKKKHNNTANYWVCVNCTLHNDLKVDNCSACDAPRGSRKRRRVEASASVSSSTEPTINDTDDHDAFLSRVFSSYTDVDALEPANDLL